ncbi:MAG: 4-(cytidine 5'-diphospho)-2-C-methyl-D-erythritol kinase [bacterium]
MIFKIKTPAKINTFLKITGYDQTSNLHYIESLMVPVDFYDTLEIEESDKFEVSVSGMKNAIPTEKNIVFKAYNAFQTALKKRLPSFKVVINKSIPVGAGLGGGSSNAAGFIMFLNDHLKLNLTNEKLKEIAFSVGSDVPFFIHPAPAFVSGKGEIVKSFKLEQISKYLLLIFPEIIVNTSHAYSLFDKKKLTKSSSLNINIVRQIETGSLKDWTKVIYNDFEELIFEEFPLLPKLKESLLRSGSEKVFMSGSGSSLIAVFDSEKMREKTFNQFRDKFATVKKIALLTG